MMVLPTEDQIREDVKALETFDHAALKMRYQELTGAPPPKRIGRTLLKLAVAYELQSKTHRRLVERVNRRLSSVVKNGGVLSKPKRAMKPGGRLVREWRGKSYEVYVADDGVFMEGKRYGSLSAAAFAITGAKWNGPRFFGLRSPRSDGAPSP